MANTILVRRGTSAQITAAKGSNSLIAFEPIFNTNTSRLEISTTPNTSVEMVKMGDVSAVGLSGSFADLLSKPTTLAGYGITDGLDKSANLSDLPDKSASRANLGADNASNLVLGTLPEERLLLRLRSNNQNNSWNDFNTALDNGNYLGHPASTNVPVNGNYWNVLVQRTDNTHVTQTASMYSTQGSPDTKTYQRLGVLSGGVWTFSNWYRLRWSEQEIQNLSSPISAYRNKIINGDFDFWQRGTSFSLSSTASSLLGPDRWRLGIGVTGTTMTVTQAAFSPGENSVPGNPTYGIQLNCSATANTSDSFHIFYQTIENVRLLSGKKVTVTFWAASTSGPKSISVEIIQNFGSGGSPSLNVNSIGVNKIALTTVWQKYTFTVDVPSISGKTIGTTPNTSSLGLVFWLSAGSTYNARTNSLGNQTGVFVFSHISLVEGDATKEDDPFSPRHAGQELALCQRYYQKSYDLTVNPGTAPATAGALYGSAQAACNYLSLHAVHPVRMRGTPSIVVYNPITGEVGSCRVDNLDKPCVGAAFENSMRAYINNSAVAVNQFMSVHYTLEAEL